MSSGYFNFDNELGKCGERYAVNCFKNLVVIEGYHTRGSEVPLPDNIDPDLFYCIRRKKGTSIAVKGYHLLNVVKNLGRNTAPVEAIIEAHKNYDKILNFSTIDKSNMHQVLPSTKEDDELLTKNHSSYVDKSKYDFSIDIHGDDYKVEVKTDAQTPISGNIFIEFEQNTASNWEFNWDEHCKASGMHLSEADIWAYLLSPEVFLFMSPGSLTEIYENRFVKPLRVVLGGNKTPNEQNPRTKGVLIPIHHYLDLDLSLSRENNFMSNLVKSPEYSLL